MLRMRAAGGSRKFWYGAILLALLGAGLATMFGGSTTEEPTVPAAWGVVDGQRLAIRTAQFERVILQNGQMFRLVGLELPHDNLMNALTVGQNWRIEPQNGLDDFGVAWAVFRRGDGTTIQEQLLESGAALLRVDVDVPMAWRTAEQNGRTAKLGLWETMPLSATQIAAHPSRYDGQFLVFVGEVTDIGFTRSSIWINFGEDWRIDLSLRLLPAQEEEFHWLSPELIGKSLECRGLSRIYYGAVVDIRHPNACFLVRP